MLSEMKTGISSAWPCSLVRKIGVIDGSDFVVLSADPETNPDADSRPILTRNEPLQLKHLVIFFGTASRQLGHRRTSMFPKAFISAWVSDWFLAWFQYTYLLLSSLHSWLIVL
jgi:hypothetical protein